MYHSKSLKFVAMTRILIVSTSFAFVLGFTGCVKNAFVSRHYPYEFTRISMTTIETVERDMKIMTNSNIR